MRRSYPFRVEARVRGVEGQVAVDQIRAVERRRLARRVGSLDTATGERLLHTLTTLFAP